jgi:hypothetical protein
MTEKLLTALVAYLRGRVPEVGERVRPFAGPPSDDPPYLTYAIVGHTPLAAHDAHDGKQGHAGAARTRVQVDVWDTDHLRKVRIADKIVGSREAPGLAGRRGWFPVYSDPNRVAVQACRLVGDPFEDQELPEDGGERRWYRTVLEFEFHYAER